MHRQKIQNNILKSDKQVESACTDVCHSKICILHLGRMYDLGRTYGAKIEPLTVFALSVFVMKEISSKICRDDMTE